MPKWGKVVFRSGDQSVEIPRESMDTFLAAATLAAPRTMEVLQRTVEDLRDQAEARWPRPGDGISTKQVTGRSHRGLATQLTISSSGVEAAVVNTARKRGGDTYVEYIRANATTGKPTWKILVERPGTRQALIDSIAEQIADELIDISLHGAKIGRK